MKTSLLITLAFLPAFASYADTATENAVEANSIKTEFPTEETHEPGFLGTPISQAIERSMRRTDRETEYKYGRTVTDFATAPKVGGYYMSGYYYSSQEGAHNGDGFKQKNVRLYVSGSVFKHFNYLVQALQLPCSGATRQCRLPHEGLLDGVEEISRIQREGRPVHSRVRL